MSRFQRGEIWLVDLGMVAKTRLTLLLSVPYDDIERAVVTFVPRTGGTVSRFAKPREVAVVQPRPVARAGGGRVEASRTWPRNDQGTRLDVHRL